MTSAPRPGTGPAMGCRPTGESDRAHGTVDDGLVAALLMRMWALASGHAMPEGPPDQLSEEDLIEFWADDMRLGSGRHASAEG